LGCPNRYKYPRPSLTVVEYMELLDLFFSFNDRQISLPIGYPTGQTLSFIPECIINSVTRSVFFKFVNISGRGPDGSKGKKLEFVHP
jgi:hypothetical protein